MKHFSTTNTVQLSTGERISRSALEGRIRAAKQQKIDDFILANEYCFCEDCDHNGTEYRLDVSHEESVDSCIKNGYAEKAYDLDNMRIRCRKCHQKKDGLGVQWT